MQISDSSFVRLRRARDRVAWAQTLVETASQIAGTTADAAGTSLTANEAERDLGTIIAAAMREAVELLARGWPEDYPAGAVEFEILSELSKRCSIFFNEDSSGRIFKEDISVQQLGRRVRKLRQRQSLYLARSCSVPAKEPS